MKFATIELKRTYAFAPIAIIHNNFHQYKSDKLSTWLKGSVMC